MNLYYQFYLVISGGVIIWLTSHAQRKVFLALLMVWLIGFPILDNPNFIIRITALGFELQATRILFLCFLPMFVIEWKNRLKYGINHGQKIGFEKWLLAYAASIFLAIVINPDQFSDNEIIVLISNTLLFIFIYFLSKWFITPADFKLFSKCVLFLAIATSIIGAVQFLFDGSFFNLGKVVDAFSSFSRGKGIFSNNDTQGFFLAVALAIGLLKIHNRFFKILFSFVISIGIFFSMLRTAWLFAILVFVVIFIKKYYHFPQKIFIYIYVVTTILTLWFLITSLVPLQTASNSVMNTFILDRALNTQNFDIRMDLNVFGLKTMLNFPFGLGQYSTKYYGLSQNMTGLNYVVHNSIIGGGVKYGVMGFITIILFFVGILNYFLSNLNSNHFVKFLGTIVCSIFIIYSLFFDVSSPTSQSFLIFSLFLGVFVGLEQNKSIHQPLIHFAN